MQRSHTAIFQSFEFFLKKSLRKVLHSGAVLHRGISGLPLQDLDELHKKKQTDKKNTTTCETPSKNKTKQKFKESDLKYEPYSKASFPTLSI